jgi:hypothetical protein
MAAEHHGADLASANAADLVERASQRLSGVLKRRDVFQPPIVMRRGEIGFPLVRRGQAQRLDGFDPKGFDNGLHGGASFPRPVFDVSRG